MLKVIKQNKIFAIFIGILVLSFAAPIVAEIVRTELAYQIEQQTDALKIIDYAHHEVHGGHSFRTFKTQTTTNTGERTIIAFKTGDTAKWCHLIAEFDATAISGVSIVEAPTITVNTGTALTVFNHNRNSIQTSGVTSINGPLGSATFYTVADQANVSTGNGVALFKRSVGGSGFKSAIGGGTRGSNELILKQDTVYAFVVESLDDNDNHQAITLDWYEHTNKGRTYRQQ